MKILVTGATGFVGSALCKRLTGEFEMRAALLSSDEAALLPAGVEHVTVGDIGAFRDWDSVLSGVDTVVHLAARVHVMRDTASDPLEAFRSVNTYGTERLATHAAQAGVKRFVFISSVKVNGEETPVDKPFSEDSVPNPVDPYGISKWEAEQALHQVERQTGMEVVIVRPSVVYGPSVRGNILALLKLADKALPLPLKGVCNKRSFLGLGNMADFLCLCATHPGAAGQTFLLSDRRDISTSELLSVLARALGKPDRQFRLPTPLLGVCARVLHARNVWNRLSGSLIVDASKTHRVLGWTPPNDLEAGIQLMTDWYRGEGRA